MLALARHCSSPHAAAQPRVATGIQRDVASNAQQRQAGEKLLAFEARQSRTALTTIAKAHDIDIYTRRHNADQVTLSASLIPK